MKKMHMLNVERIMAQSIPSMAIPLPGICQVFVILMVLAVGNLLENLCRKPRVEHLSILLEAVNIIPFSIFHLKLCLFRLLAPSFT